MWGDPWEFESPLPQSLAPTARPDPVSAGRAQEDPLDVTTEPLADRQLKLTIVVRGDELTQVKRDIVKALGKRAQVPGYRPGTAPLERVEAVIGAEALETEAVERLAARAVRQHAPAAELDGRVQGRACVTQRDPFTIEVTLPLRPAVTLGDYRALRVPPIAPAAVDEAAVDALIEGWRNEMAVLADVDRPAARGDVVSLALTGRHGDDVVFEAAGLTVVLDPERWDAERLPPAVIDGLVGATVAAPHAFTVTYPAFWPDAALQDQPVAFEATVVRVAELQPPALDDTLAASMADVDSVAELRQRVREQLESRANLAVQDAEAEAAIDALVAGAEVAYPPQLLEAEIHRAVHDLKAKVERHGFEFEHWLSIQPEGVDALYAQIERDAATRLRRQLVLSEFCVAEGIRVKASEIDDEVRSFSRLASVMRPGRGRRREAMPSVDDMRSSFGSRILSSRAVARLLAITRGQADGDGAPAAAVASPPLAASAAGIDTQP